MAPSPVSICLFERSQGGHFEHFTREVALALAPVASVTIAASDDLVDLLSDVPVELVGLGEPRARGGVDGGPSNEELALEELELVRGVCSQRRPDHLFHLYSEPILRWLLKQPPMPCPVTTIVFHPCWHYPSAFGTRPTPMRALRGLFLEYKVQRWRQRPDANAIFTPDPEAAKRWRRRRGAPAHWLAEYRVPVPEGLTPPESRQGCAIWGGFERRKGIDLLADALELGPPVPPVFVAGNPVPGFDAEIQDAIARMRAAGAPVDVRLGRLPIDEGLRVLGSARCAVIPYRWHPGTSRVLSEAAALGVPVVGPDSGLVGHYIREHGLGIAVDPEDSAALREAVLSLTQDPEAHSRYEPGLRRFTEMTIGGYAGCIRAAFGLS